MDKRFSILLVDDNPINIKVLMESLAKNNYKILSATNGNKALAIASKVIPDLILLDINMPGINGYDTCKKLKENPETRQIPVIFLSALNEIENKVQGFKVGAVDYITKPFQREEVLARVKTQLEVGLLQRELLNKNDKINSLLHILTHDIQNQIMTINMSAYMSIKETKNEEDEYVHNLVLVQRSAQIISNLINKIRKISSLDNEKLELNLQPYNLKKIEKHVSESFYHRLRDKKISFNFDIDDITLDVDEIFFTTTIIDNLISNAIKFSYKGSEVSISAKEEEDSLCIKIIDRGVGMSNEQLLKVFRKDINTTTEGTDGEKGTGFGLPLVKKYTEAMNGSIEIQSRAISDDSEEHGSEIILTFPKLVVTETPL